MKLDALAKNPEARRQFFLAHLSGIVQATVLEPGLSESEREKRWRELYAFLKPTKDEANES